MIVPTPRPDDDKLVDGPERTDENVEFDEIDFSGPQVGPAQEVTYPFLDPYQDRGEKSGVTDNEPSLDPPVTGVNMPM